MTFHSPDDLSRLDLSFLQHLQHEVEFRYAAPNANTVNPRKICHRSKRASSRTFQAESGASQNLSLDGQWDALLPSDKYLEQEASQAFSADQASTRVHGELLGEPEIDAKLMELSSTDTECELYSQLSSRTRDVLSRTFPDWKIQDAGDVLGMATSRSFLRSMPLTPASQTLPANLISSDLDKSARRKPEQDNLPEQTADNGSQLSLILEEAIRLRFVVGDHVSLQLEVVEEHSIHPDQSREHGTLSIPPPGSTSAHHNCATTHRMPAGFVADGLAATAPSQQSEISSWQREGEELGSCHSCFTVHQFHRGQRDYLREISIQKKYRLLEMQLNQALAELRNDDLLQGVAALQHVQVS